MRHSSQYYIYIYIYTFNEKSSDGSDRLLPKIEFSSTNSRNELKKGKLNNILVSFGIFDDFLKLYSIAYLRHEFL